MPQQSITPSLATSLRKGQIGVIHAFASLQQRRRNAVVITHELIRTFDA